MIRLLVSQRTFFKATLDHSDVVSSKVRFLLSCTSDAPFQSVCHVCHGAGHCQDSIKNDTCRWQGPSTLTHTTAVASAGTSQGSEPSTMRAATPGSQGAGVAPDIAAAGSGTDATAAGFG